MVLEGLGYKMIDLIKYWIARSMDSRMVARSMKYGLGEFGSGYSQFDKASHGEMCGFWKDGHFLEIWSWMVWVRNWSLWYRIEWRDLCFLEGLPNLRNASPWSVVEAVPQARPKTTWNSRNVMCVICVSTVFDKCLLNWGGVGVLVPKCRCYAFLFFIFRTRFPFPCWIGLDWIGLDWIGIARPWTWVAAK